MMYFSSYRMLLSLYFHLFKLFYSFPFQNSRTFLIFLKLIGFDVAVEDDGITGGGDGDAGGGDGTGGGDGDAGGGDGTGGAGSGTAVVAIDLTT